MSWSGRLPLFLDHARAVAETLRDVPGLRIVPDPPQTPLFHVHLEGERDVLWARMLDLAQTKGVWLANRVEYSVLPGVSKLEINIGRPALEIAPPEAAELFAAVLAR